MSRYRVDGHDKGDFASGRIAWNLLNLAGSIESSGVTEIDCSGLELVRPSGVACLCACARSNQKLKWIEPTGDPARSYLRRLAIPEWFTAAKPHAEPEECQDCRVLQLTDRPGNLSTTVIRSLVDPSQTPGGLLPRLENHLDEVIINALVHADSSIGCVVAAQVFKQAGFLEVAVLDLGITILAHLKRRPRYGDLSDDRQAILLATEEGVTGTEHLNKWNEPNSGIGLFELRRFCESGGGVLAILSGWDLLAFSDEFSEPRHHHSKFWFKGTLVNMRFHL